jgi:hypothetical protein
LVDSLIIRRLTAINNKIPVKKHDNPRQLQAWPATNTKTAACYSFLLFKKMQGEPSSCLGTIAHIVLAHKLQHK